VVDTHGAIIQLLLAHYLDMTTGAFVRLQVNHGSVSVLRFFSDMQLPQVLGINLGVPVASVLASSRPLGRD
jgi:broad specificity phosphatase PhoE